MSLLGKNLTINKIVDVKPIKKKVSFFDYELSVFENAVTSFDLPIDPIRRSRFDIFENSLDLQREYEDALSLQRGTLNLSRDNAYFNDMIIKIPAEGIRLNLNSVIDALKFRILEANNTTIAPSWNERNDDLRYKFAFREEGHEDIEVNKKGEEIYNKVKAFIKIEDSVDKMKSVLSILGKSFNDNKNISIDSLRANIRRVMEDPLLSNKFVDIVNDPYFSERVLIDNALKARALMKAGKNGYKLPKGEEPIADDTKEMIDWILNPKNSVKVETIKSQIELANKK
jgi:hypothetical protein